MIKIGLWLHQNSSKMFTLDIVFTNKIKVIVLKYFKKTIAVVVFTT